MNWNRWIRQIHRWPSIALTGVVIFNTIAVVQGRYANWMGLLAVFPLALLFLTGMCLFLLPYAARWRSPRLSQ